MKPFNLLLALVLLSGFTSANAQSNQTAKAVFVELGGAGLPFSFNFDTRFNKGKQNGAGLRAGIGGFAIEDEKMFTVPVQVNWLFGREKNFFELGIGATFLHYDGYEYYENYTCNQTGCFPSGKKYAGEFLLPVNNINSVMGTMTFGYRRMPVSSGFMWKAAITPVFNSNGFWPFWAGVGLGYKF